MRVEHECLTVGRASIGLTSRHCSRQATHLLHRDAGQLYYWQISQRDTLEGRHGLVRAASNRTISTQTGKPSINRSPSNLQLSEVGFGVIAFRTYG